MYLPFFIFSLHDLEQVLNRGSKIGMTMPNLIGCCEESMKRDRFCKHSTLDLVLVRSAEILPLTNLVNLANILIDLVGPYSCSIARFTSS